MHCSTRLRHRFLGAYFEDKDTLEEELLFRMYYCPASARPTPEEMARHDHLRDERLRKIGDEAEQERQEQIAQDQRVAQMMTQMMQGDQGFLAMGGMRAGLLARLQQQLEDRQRELAALQLLGARFEAAATGMRT